MPEIDTVLVEDPDPNCPFGAKEVGQGPLLPMMPAVANAIFDAVGVRIDEMPITPDKVLQALRAQGEGRGAARRPRALPRRAVRGADVSCRRRGRVATATPRAAAARPRRPQGGGHAMMRLPWFRYEAPRTVAEAARMLAAEGPGAMLVAGGTDLLPNMKRRQQTPQVAGVAVAGRRAEGASPTAHGLALGAGVTLADVARSDARARSATAALWQAAAQVATAQLRNMGTLGGNLCLDTRCNYYDQNYEWRKAIDFCMKKDGDDLLGRDRQQALRGRVVDRLRAGADRARGDACGSSRPPASASCRSPSSTATTASTT